MIRSPGTVIARAPVRISFGGGGTDLAEYYMSHGGFVVSAAITRHAYAVASDSPDGSFHFSSCDYHIWQTFEGVPSVEEPLSLVKAAVEWFADYGLREIGVDLFLASEVPPGTGLGSSSAMTAAVIRALAAYTGHSMSAADVAELACRLEIERLGMPIGKQDQYASAFGGLNAVHFAATGVEVDPIPMMPAARAALEDRLLLFSTGRSRDSSEILRTQKADSARREPVVRSLHQLKQLAEEMRAALLAGDLDGFGYLLDEAWQHKKRLSNKISSRAIDRWYDAACKAGALGGKITGAGGGGFLLLYCPPERQEAVRRVLAARGLQEMTFGFDEEGARVLAAETRITVPANVAIVAERRPRRQPATLPHPAAERAALIRDTG